jgi:Concanavalin A-like lectin/glucanases superfamily
MTPSFPLLTVGVVLVYDFQIALLKRDVIATYTEGQESPVCQSLRTWKASIDGLTHVAVTLGSMESRMYINGEFAFAAALSNNFNPNLQHWYLASSSLQLFGARYGEGSFRGSIHQLDIFDVDLNATEINELYNEGIDYVKPESVQVAANLEQVVILQNATKPTFHLGSVNTSSPVLNLEIQLLSLPEHGVLTLDGLLVELKQRLPIPMGSSSILLEYHANSSTYFNVPSSNAFNESLFDGDFFTFKVVARDFRQIQIASSSAETRNVNVIHVNHQGILVTPQEVSRDLIDPRFVTVSDIEYSDPLDMNVDFVRVDLRVSHGELSLFPTYRDRADFVSCATRAGEWSCVGDGINDKEMTFLAIPDDVQLVLSSLSYRTDHPSQAGELIIRKSDGAEGTCLTQSEHAHLMGLDGDGAFVARNECFQSQSKIFIPSHNVLDSVDDPAVDPVVDPVVDPAVDPAVDPVHDPNVSAQSDGFFLRVADLSVLALAIVIGGCGMLGYQRVAQSCANGKVVDADKEGDISAEDTEAVTEAESEV